MQVLVQATIVFFVLVRTFMTLLLNFTNHRVTVSLTFKFGSQQTVCSILFHCTTTFISNCLSYTTTEKCWKSIECGSMLSIALLQNNICTASEQYLHCFRTIFVLFQNNTCTVSEQYLYCFRTILVLFQNNTCTFSEQISRKSSQFVRKIFCFRTIFVLNQNNISHKLRALTGNLFWIRTSIVLKQYKYCSETVQVLFWKSTSIVLKQYNGQHRAIRWGNLPYRDKWSC